MSEVYTGSFGLKKKISGGKKKNVKRVKRKKKHRSPRIWLKVKSHPRDISPAKPGIIVIAKKAVLTIIITLLKVGQIFKFIRGPQMRYVAGGLILILVLTLVFLNKLQLTLQLERTKPRAVRRPNKKRC